ncbi:MAG: hypothetical protein WDW38_009601 [Sanguina aurantia]
MVKALLTFRDALVNRSSTWKNALASWKCPTDPSSSDEECDPCSKDWSGNWEHIHCRGSSAGYGEGSRGVYDGYVTNVHITDMHIDGPTPREMCLFTHLREFDLDGGNQAGPFPDWIADPSCVPGVQELDLSYNRLTGTLPVSITTKPLLSELKVEHNEMVGSIPPEIGSMPSLRVLRLEFNHFSGTIPASLSKLNGTLNQLELAHNDFQGDLHALANLRFLVVSTSDNPRLCGMVPMSVRYAHGYNPGKTNLGRPCPEPKQA